MTEILPIENQSSPEESSFVCSVIWKFVYSIKKVYDSSEMLSSSGTISSSSHSRSPSASSFLVLLPIWLSKICLKTDFSKSCPPRDRFKIGHYSPFRVLLHFDVSCLSRLSLRMWFSAKRILIYLSWLALLSIVLLCILRMAFFAILVSCWSLRSFSEYTRSTYVSGTNKF